MLIDRYLGRSKDVMISLFRVMSMFEMMSCRLVCKAWSTLILRNACWIYHVARLEQYFPNIRVEYLDKLRNSQKVLFIQLLTLQLRYNQQEELEGGQLQVKPARKRRKIGGKRKVEPKKKWIPIDGHWKGIRKFIQDKQNLLWAIAFNTFKNFSVIEEKQVYYLEFKIVCGNDPICLRMSLSQGYFTLWRDDLFACHIFIQQENIRNTLIGYCDLYVEA